MSKGILGRKLGMTQIWDENNRVVPVTVIEAGPCRVVQLKTPERDGYSAVQLSFGETKERRLSKPELGHLKKSGAPASKHLAEMRVSDLSGFEVGQIIPADIFVAGELVDVSGVSKGKGFAGGMKRWNFRGLEASHGVSVSHRSLGSTGNRQDPGKTFKNKKMPGHLGVERVTTLNLVVAGIDVDRGLIMVRGAVPGSKGEFVFVRDAIKKKRPDDAPYPAGFAGSVAAVAEAQAE